LKIDNGITINHLHGKDIDQFKGTFNSYAGQVGIEYLERKYFYLSSEIGYVKLGGEAERPIGYPEAFTSREEWSFVHLNTIFRGRVSVSKTEIFAGIGPYLNILAGDSKMKNALYSGYTVPRTNWGGRVEAGINENTGRVKIGLYTSCLFPFSATVKTPYTSWDARSIAIYASVGYRLK
jgi:hypothetical protein